MRTKLNIFTLSYFVISLYIFKILIPFHQSKSLLSENYSREWNFTSNKKNMKYNDSNIRKKLYGDKDGDDENDKEWRDNKEWEEEQIKNLTADLESLRAQKNDQDKEIAKAILYLVLLGILAFILLLVINIYTSIKCYILCSSARNADYLISRMSLNHLGEVYLDINGEEKFKKSENYNNAVNYDAPISADSGSEKRYNTFNPDNFVSSEEDKKLYRPYKSEEMN
jgi:hypothetical protein